jgi:hypothetical protein
MTHEFPASITTHDFWPVALVRITSEQVAAAGFKLHHDFDDLDGVVFANIVRTGAAPIYLSRHDNDPNPGFTVDASSEFSRAEALLIVERALHCLKDDYEWITPYHRFPGYNPDLVNSSLIAVDRDGTPLDGMPWSRRFEGLDAPAVRRPA